MTFFTGLEVCIAALCVYALLFVIGINMAIMLHASDDDAALLGGLFVGIFISLLLAIFICNPEEYGYQKITVSDNVVEEVNK